MVARELRIRPLTGLPELREGDDLGGLVAAAEPAAGDIVVLSQKAVSKAEGRLRRLAHVDPGDEAGELAIESSPMSRDADRWLSNCPPYVA